LKQKEAAPTLLHASPSSHLTSPAHSKLHQMIHKRLQTNVVCEDRLRGLAHTTVAASRMRGRWVEFGEKEARLRPASVAHDEARQWEAVLNEFL
jgi:hypothetical protein